MATATTPPTTGLRHDQNEHGLKRRQSEEPDDAVDSKRQRTSPGKNSPTTTRDDATGEKESNDTSLEEQKPADTGDTLRKSSAVDEKQRSKRLFGALLGNLRQPGDRTSKRRQEIESRSKAKLQRQDDERLEDRQRRLEQLAEQRKITQVRVDEQNMHRRHRAMLDKANFLQTQTEPRLFYRPWDLRDDEEDRIEDQVKDVQNLIDKEVAEFSARQGQKSAEHNGNEDPMEDSKDDQSRLEDDAKEHIDAAPQNGADGSRHDQTTAKSDHAEETTAADAPENVPNTNTDATNYEEDAPANARPGSRGEGEDGGDDGEHVQDGDEDAVIY